MNFSVERKGISEQVADYIKQLIHEGKYKAGQKIPGEREMSAQLQVSRNTVREAYKILEAYGYVTVKHGTGVFVSSEEEQIRKMTQSFFVTTDQVKDLFAIRKVLEEKAVEWAIENADEEQIMKLREIVLLSKEVADREIINYQKLFELDQQFHLSLTKMSKNSVLNRIMHNLIDLLGKSRMQSIQIPGRALQSIKEHEDIMNAIIAKDVSKAKKHMVLHLESVEKSITDSLDNADQKEE